jgi:PAS domain S-box-containing protein
MFKRIPEALIIESGSREKKHSAHLSLSAHGASIICNDYSIYRIEGETFLTEKETPRREKKPRRGTVKKVKPEAAPAGNLHKTDEARLLVDLQIHQAELEAQNRSLQSALEELEHSRTTYSELYDSAPVGYMTLDRRETIVDANITMARLLGVERTFLRGRPLAAFLSPQESQAFSSYLEGLFGGKGAREAEIGMKTIMGKTFWALLESSPGTDTRGKALCRTVVTDITARKEADRRKKLLGDILCRLNSRSTQLDAIGDILQAIKDFTDFDAVAIRLREGEDFPYYVHYGFPDYFIEQERSLCARDPLGVVIRDSAGYPIMECMCGNILCTRTDPSKPFFTRGGSFWSNWTTELLATTTEKDRQARTRNRCNGEGYESVALVPIIAGAEIIGLIQLNDSRRDRFTPDLMEFFEEIGASIGAALERKLFADELTKHREHLELLVSERTKELERIGSRYRALFDNASDAIFIRGVEGPFIEVNHVACERLGYSRDELLRLSPLDIDSPDYAFLLSERTREIHEKGHHLFESAHVTKEGRVIPVEISSRLIEFEGEEAILSIARDITERRKVQKALRESEKKFSTAFHASTVLMALTTLNEGLLIDVNEAYLKTMGYTAGEVIGKTAVEIGLFPEKAGREVMLEGMRQKGFIRNTEMTLQAKSGERFTIYYSGDIIRFQDRECIFSVMVDITKRKRAEAILKESEERYRSLFETMLDGCAYCKMFYEDDRPLDFVYLSVNDAFEKLTGLKNVVGAKVTQVIPGIRESHPELFEACGRVALSGVPERFEIYLEQLRAWLDIALCSPKKEYFVAIFDNITERRAMESDLIQAKEKAEAANRLKSSFLANMSHEFRTPLHGIIGLAEILHGQVEDQDMKETVDYIRDSGKRLYETLDSFMKLSQLTAGEFNVTLRPLFCASLAEKALRRHRESAEAKGLALHLETIAECEIMADEEMLHCILHNLVDNALKFTSRGEVRVTIGRARKEGAPWAEICVKDTGIGIAPEHYDLLFQEFRQISEGFSRNYEGVGLGLTLAKKMTELLGGTLTFESERGRGTTFALHFPLLARSPEISAAPTHTQRPPEKHRGPSPELLPAVLLVEDNFINARVIINYLEAICIVDHARDAESALSMACQKPYKALLIDINLGPAMDGIALQKEIRKFPAYEHCPMVALTGYALSGDREGLLMEGFNHYLAKPFDERELRDLVEEMLLSRVTAA